jgi:hydroxymethylpyrimidine pyrophosphatase-like HAD family hydrolase
MNSNAKHKHHHLIGQRIVKSAVSIGLCFLVYVLRGWNGIPFYTALASLQCMQAYRQNTRKIAIQRITGTFVGAFYGLWVILLQRFLLQPYHVVYLGYCVAVALGVVASLFTAVHLKKKNAAYFSCVVFLSVTMVHIGDENPYLFVFNRVLDTLIGVAIGMGVNAFHLPRRKQKDVLFVTALDDVLLARTSTMSDYSKVELNRILDEGIALSIMTMRTPASFLEAAGDIRVSCPVILMDGAVLYDVKNNSFPAKRELPHEDAAWVIHRLQEMGVETFQNVICGNSVLIYYQDINNDGSQQVFDRLRKSPYRNYLHRPLPEGEPVAYLMAMDSTEKIQAAYAALCEDGADEKYKILCYPSDEYPSYSYLKVYRKDATKQNMLKTLMELTGYQTVRTYGSIPGAYDHCVDITTGDEVVRLLKREFEPLRWSFGAHS